MNKEKKKSSFRFVEEGDEAKIKDKDKIPRERRFCKVRKGGFIE